MLGEMPRLVGWPDIADDRLGILNHGPRHIWSALPESTKYLDWRRDSVRCRAESQNASVVA